MILRDVTATSTAIALATQDSRSHLDALALRRESAAPYHALAMSATAPRLNVSSASPYEDVIGFSRAVRVGPYVHVSGTTAIGGDGKLVADGDVRGQAAQVLHNIRKALESAGASMADVVRTRIYLRDIEHWRRVAEAHREAFGDIRPAATMVAVTRFVDPNMLIEIEADAYVGAESAP